nr:hypothetical protein B0A51_01177 [Rachicladosporium sp. CCFEE 5018]
MAIDQPHPVKTHTVAQLADADADDYVMVAKTKVTDAADSADKTGKDDAMAPTVLPHGDDLFDMAIKDGEEASSGKRFKSASAVQVLLPDPGTPRLTTRPVLSATANISDTAVASTTPDISNASTMPGSWDAQAAAPDSIGKMTSEDAAAEAPMQESWAVDTESTPSLKPIHDPHVTPVVHLANAFSWLPVLAFDGHSRNAAAAFRYFITEFINGKYHVDLAIKRDTSDLEGQIPGIAFYIVEEFGAKLWPGTAAAGELDPVVGNLEKYLEALFTYSKSRSGSDLGYDQKLIDVLRNPLPSSGRSETDEAVRDSTTNKLLQGRNPHEVLNEAFHALCAFPHAKIAGHHAPSTFKLMTTTWCKRHFQAVDIDWDVQNAHDMDEHAPQIALAFVQKHHENVWREKDEGLLAYLIAPLEHYLRVLFRVPAEGPETTSPPSPPASEAVTEKPEMIRFPIRAFDAFSYSSLPPHLRKPAPKTEQSQSVTQEAPVAVVAPKPKLNEPGSLVGLMCTAPECDKLEGHYIFATGQLLREHLEMVHEFDEEMAREYTGKSAVVRWGYP